MAVCSHLFVRLAQIERRALGMPDLPMAITQHPIGGLKADAVLAKADDLLDEVLAGLTAQYN